ncbi:hypothetical protein GCM10009839_00330 [Catenulispora yoronensis]|uniref:Ig-like domain-containing protein n=1 Tax=Catenulispora yoronensis TaxID=450799 RepID=A0ABP5EZ59_9ACTN
MTSTRHATASRPRSARRSAAGSAAVLLAATGFNTLLPAGPAHATASTLTCTGTSHLAYSPGLTFTPQTVTVTETDAYTCTSTDTTITSGYTSGSFSATGVSCAYVTVAPDRYRVTWNNGQTSRVAFTETEVTVTGGIQQYVGTGTVTSGEFTGATAVFTWVYLPPSPLDCLAPGGLTSQDGTVIADITGL